MSDCIFKITPQPDGRYLHQCQNPECTHGDRILKAEVLHRNCNGPENKVNGGITKTVTTISLRAARFATALVRWQAAGRPERSKEAVQQIYHEHCKPCDNFDAEKKACKICGCHCKEEHKSFLNKIVWATENCPRKKW